MCLGVRWHTLRSMLTKTVDGHAIRVLRERKGLTMREVVGSLADQGVNVKPNHLYRVELGYCQPSAKVLVAIAKAIDVDQDELFTDATDAA